MSIQGTGLHHYPADDAEVIQAGERLDIYTAGTLRSLARDLTDAGHLRLIVDMDRTTFMDTTGLAVLVGLHRYALTHGGRLTVVGASKRVLRLFRDTTMDRVLDIQPTVEAALAAGLGATHD